MAADEGFQVTRFKIYGLLFNPEGGINEADGPGDGKKKEKWASVPAAKHPNKTPRGGAKGGGWGAASAQGKGKAGEEEEDDDDEYEYEEEEEATEYTYEVIEVSDDEDDDDLKVIHLGDEDTEESIQVYYDDDLFIGFKVTTKTTTEDIIRQGHKKLHLRSNAVQFSLFIIKNGTDIRKLHNDEQPLLRMKRYANMDIKFAFLSTMSSFDIKMRNNAFQKWLLHRLSFVQQETAAAPPATPATESATKLQVPNIDLSDGLVLFDLLSVLEFPAVAKFNKKPRTVKDKLKNINKALASFREAGCIIPEHVTPDQVRKGSPVAVLDLLWGIIYRAHAPQITESSMEFMFMDELLYWCLCETKEYEGINQDDIHASLCDGLAWCALVHKHEPDAINYQMTYYAATKLNRKKSETCKLAFDAAEKVLAIPRLLDPKNFDKEPVDELSLIIYLACWYDKLGEAKVKKTEGQDEPGSPQKKKSAEEKEREKKKELEEKRQEDLRKRQEEHEQKLNEEARKEEEKLAKARRKDKEKLEKQKKKGKEKEKSSMTIPFLFQGFEDDFVTFRTYACDRYISVSETYELVAKDLSLGVGDFVLIQRKKGVDNFLLIDEERLLFKEKEKTDKCVICTKKAALKPEQLEALKKKKP